MTDHVILMIQTTLAHPRQIQPAQKNINERISSDSIGINSMSALKIFLALIIPCEKLMESALLSGYRLTNVQVRSSGRISPRLTKPQQPELSTGSTTLSYRIPPWLAKPSGSFADTVLSSPE